MNERFFISLAAAGLIPVTGYGHTRPNIIYIMCDDMGYGDLGCYGQRLISTPNLDRMAQDGMRFTQAYAGSPVSAPSRACFMTGQHSGHGHVRGNREYWQSAMTPDMYSGQSDYSIIGQEPYDVTHQIIPELFKQAGYTTGMFGKWAGGYWNSRYPDTYIPRADGNTDTSQSAVSSSMSLPNLRGIDCYFGPICQFQAHTYYPNFINRYDPSKGDKHVVAVEMTENTRHATVFSGDPDFENRTQYSADSIHHYALEWLDRQDSRHPFLGIFTYTLPHAELWQPNDSILQHYTQAFLGDDSPWRGQPGNWYHGNAARHAQFAAMITRLDTYIGEIRNKLAQKGLDQNTLIIFTSDNGPHEEGGADPDWFNRDGLLQGKKRSTYEGGIRIPFIACGPGVPKGVTNDHQLAFYDLMPTFLDYAGLHKEARMHSLDASSPDDMFDGISFYRTLTGKKGQKKHEYLYWEFHETDMLGIRSGDWKMVVSSGHCKLFNLATDLHEDHDVADQYPQIVTELKEAILHEHIDNPLFPVTLPR